MNPFTALFAPLAIAGTLPNVPGAIDPNVTQANIQSTICVSGYTKTVRPPARYTNALKREQMERGHIGLTTKQIEEDHLIPLAIGGNPTDHNNLWPEPRTGPWNAATKDRLEVKLHTLVCNGQVSLGTAQQAIAKNWIQAYQQYVGNSPAHSHKRRKKNWSKYF
jgi:hypothetical protein